jgi:hypothetical protein
VNDGQWGVETVNLPQQFLKETEEYRQFVNIPQQLSDTFLFHISTRSYAYGVYFITVLCRGVREKDTDSQTHFVEQ